MPKTILKIFLISFITLSTGCAGFLPSSGPSTRDIQKANRYILTVNVNYKKALELKNKYKHKLYIEFRELEENKTNIKYDENISLIGIGDTLDIFIYESPPANFFSNPEGIGIFQIPPQTVDKDGKIKVPFVGQIEVLNRETTDIAKEIEEKLSSKVNNPQVIVEISNRESKKVSVFGEVSQPRSVILDYTTSTLLDVLSSVGGIKSPIDKTIVNLYRNGQVISLPLSDVVENPSLNIKLFPGDVITVIYKTNSAVFLGASGKNQELEFESRGISLAQALGRVGGLNNDKSNAKGIFIFRLEDINVLKNIEDIKIKKENIESVNNKVPTIYRIDLTKPESFFVLKEFPLQDGDIVYIATAPYVQYQRFLQLIVNTISPIFMIDRMRR